MSDWAIIHGEALASMQMLPSNIADLIVTDPPYFKVKDEEWDNQWATPQEFIAWLDAIAAEWQRLLKANGSLYVFASPQMAARVEVMLSERFNVLNSLVWYKTTGNRNWAADKESVRSFLPNTERIIFAEQFGSDEQADSEAGYTTQREAAKRSVFGDYLRSEFDKAGVTNREIAALFPSASGGITGCVSNWLLGANCPTSEQYSAIRLHLNGRGGEYLKREYEDLKREYEDLRRPFNLTAREQFMDVWNFAPIQTYSGKHPAEKPQSLIRHIVNASSRPDALVLDTFVGSGAHGAAAVAMGRRFIGIEKDEHWANYAERRLSNGVQLPMAFAA